MRNAFAVEVDPKILDVWVMSVFWCFYRITIRSVGLEAHEKGFFVFRIEECVIDGDADFVTIDPFDGEDFLFDGDVGFLKGDDLIAACEIGAVVGG